MGIVSSGWVAILLYKSLSKKLYTIVTKIGLSLFEWLAAILGSSIAIIFALSIQSGILYLMAILEENTAGATVLVYANFQLYIRHSENIVGCSDTSYHSFHRYIFLVSPPNMSSFLDEKMEILMVQWHEVRLVWAVAGSKWSLREHFMMLVVDDGSYSCFQVADVRVPRSDFEYEI